MQQPTEVAIKIWTLVALVFFVFVMFGGSTEVNVLQ